MTQNVLYICQVSLARDIPILKENYHNFKSLYESIKIFIICPQNEIKMFKKEVNFPEVEIINEESVISFENFINIFENLSFTIKYKKQFKNRLGWYYQQILKISFVLNFLSKNQKDIIIWDADTIILKKINFFENKKSIKYGTFFEFHKPYYLTNEHILREQPKYFISFLIQFIAISKLEFNFIVKKIFNNQFNNENLAKKISEIILESVFHQHKEYNGSLFSEYELLGQLNYMFDKSKQKPLLTLRYGLSGKLNSMQKNLCRILNFKHVTYEHSYENSQGMLKREQKWLSLLKILLKNQIKFYLRKIRHNYRYFYCFNKDPKE